MAVERVTLDWGTFLLRADVETSQHPLLDHRGFYCLLAGIADASAGTVGQLALLYIGKAHDKTLREHTPQPHVSDDCIEMYMRANPGQNLFVRPGRVVRSSAVESGDLYDDIEACLIHTNAPHCNTKKYLTYPGRELDLTNTGSYAPLVQASACRPPTANDG